MICWCNMQFASKLPRENVSMQFASKPPRERIRLRACSLALLVGLTLAGWESAAYAGDLYVICSPGVTLQSSNVRDVFLGEKGFAGNVKLAPADNSASQVAFFEKVLKLDASKYAGIWTKKSFRDGVNPPPVKTTDAEAIAYVKQTVGACSYVSVVPGAGVTVIAKL
jgi:hypothetical protein